MKIKRIASKPLSVTLDTLATTTRNLLYKTKKRTAFVIDERNRPRGVVTLKTILSLASLRSNLEAKDIMERPVYSIDEDEEIEKAGKEMIKTGAKELAVLKEGALTGVIDAVSVIANSNRGKDARKIRDIATRKTDSIDAKTELPKIIGKLKRHSTLPVTKDGKLIGVVTRADIARRRFQSRELNAYTTAEKIMKTPVISVDADDDLDYAAKTLIEHNIHAMPVVEKGQLVGIITRLDILKESMRWM